MNKDDANTIVMADGDIQVWVEAGSSIYIRCSTSFGDPIEVTAEEVDELCTALRKLADEIR